MLVLLVALQLSSTNCIPDANGGLNCSTLSTPQVQAPPIPENPATGCALCNLISIFGGNEKERHAKAVGRMLAKGNCAGAEEYALIEGELDLANKVKAYCAQVASTDRPTTRPASWMYVGKAKDGETYYTDMQSFHDEGGLRSVWEIVVYPTADIRRETRALNIYKCRDRTSAVKMVVDYFRDGNVQAQTTKDSDLQFDPVVPQTVGEASFGIACELHSASK